MSAFHRWLKRSDEKRCGFGYCSSFELLQEPAAELEWMTLATYETPDNRYGVEGEWMKAMQDRGCTLVNRQRAHGLCKAGGRLYQNDPEYREKELVRMARLYHNDPEFRAKQRAYQKAYHARLHDDREYRAKWLAYHKAYHVRLSDDPVWREKKRARMQAYRARKRAERLAATLEAEAPEAEDCAEPELDVEA